ncbi:hypothetical protein EDWATA_01728 [Edwardsiella tarda ATCC 23685]|uniref:Uncharacterized protein n=1 Tax=Edwardsiella tarda ATCC 23685 TaxID=500638 RepID=D4F4Q5_EDWTA|nr:hypothetical protein EDWATA_01728 [Edwardsiella tarda ATCC 23685]
MDGLRSARCRFCLAWAGITRRKWYYYWGISTLLDRVPAPLA